MNCTCIASSPSLRSLLRSFLVFASSVHRDWRRFQRLVVRYDIKSDLLTGFPYTLGHASAIGELMACLIENRPPLKGLITDLDDTLWSGIVGEDGVDGISWNLDDHSQMHGVYQQFLSSLAAAGVLIGVASKNDAATVTQAFERPDLLLSKEDVFPVRGSLGKQDGIDPAHPEHLEHRCGRSGIHRR